jgi:tetratricopeptide (TPR) repeat protein
MTHLGVTYYDSGRYEDAAKLLEECLSKHIRTYGGGNPRLWRSTKSLCDAYLRIGRFDAAADLLEKLVPDSRMSFGDGARRTLVSEASLAEAFWGQGRSEEAAELLDKLFHKCKRILVGPVYGLDELGSLSTICETFRLLNKVHEAAELLENMMKRTTALVGSQNAEAMVAAERLCRACDALEKLDLAIELRETSLPAIKKVFGETSHITLRVTQALLKNYQATNRLKEASALESELERIKVFRQDFARPEPPEPEEPKTVDEIFERLKQKYPLQNPPAKTRIIAEKKAPQLNLFQVSRKILSAPSKWVQSLTKRR